MSVLQCFLRPRRPVQWDSAIALRCPKSETVFKPDTFTICHQYASMHQRRSASIPVGRGGNLQTNEQSRKPNKHSGKQPQKHEAQNFAAQMRFLLNPGQSLKDRTPMELEIFKPISASTQPSESATLQAENLAMLDYYDGSSGSSEDCNRNLRNHKLVVHDVQPNDPEPAELDIVSAAQRNVMKNARLLSTGLRSRILSRELAYELYRKLPSPGISHLTPRIRHLFLVKMSQIYPTERNEQTMMQYLSVFEDLHSAGIKPKLWQWATAMHLTGRYAKKVTVSELENAMRIWKRMEQSAGMRGNIITMNILLDIALKSRHLNFAELLIEEIRQRDLKQDRFTYLNTMYLYGLRGNGDGIRNSYRELVLANEVIDSMTLTCVIASFLHAGELPAAMNVYRRMQARSSPAKENSENTAKTTWDIGRLIAKFTRDHGQDPHMLAGIQGEITVRPNIITYVNLIGHHATRTGELVEIVRLLDEMRAAEVPIHGAIFNELFDGFARHGGKMFTSWTQNRLEDVWAAFKGLADAGVKDVFVGPTIALKVLEAFKECVGRVRALEVMSELRVRWRKRDESHIFDEEWLKYETGLGNPRMRNPHIHGTIQ